MKNYVRLSPILITCKKRANYAYTNTVSTKLGRLQGLLTVEKSFRSGNTGNRVFIFSVMVITGKIFLNSSADPF